MMLTTVPEEFGLDVLTGPEICAEDIARVDTLRSIVERHEYDEDTETSAVLAELAAAGFLAEMVPREYGGRQGGLALAARLVEAAAMADGSLGWLLTTQYGLHLMLPTLTNGDCAPYFADIVAKGALMAGSHSRYAVDVAADNDGGAGVTGVLRYCSGAPLAGWITTTAQVPTPDGPHGGTLMIEAGTPGIRYAPAEHLHGMRGSLTGFVYLDQVRVPRRHVHLFRDLSDPANRAVPGRYFGAWQALLLQNAVFLGIAANAMRVAAPALRKRAKHDHAVVAAGYGAAAAHLLAARSLFYHRVLRQETATEQRLEQDQADLAGHPVLLSMVANNAYMAVSRLVEQLGGSVLVSRHPLERCWRDIQLARAAEGSKWDAVQAALGVALLAE